MWKTLQYCSGDVHVFPMNDARLHTFPICWCTPDSEQQHIRRTEYGTEADGVLFTHHALDGRVT